MVGKSAVVGSTSGSWIRKFRPAGGDDSARECSDKSQQRVQELRLRINLLLTRTSI